MRPRMEALPVAKPNRTSTHRAYTSHPELRLKEGKITKFFIAPQTLSFVCSILRTLHVVNFSHLDAFVLRVYDW